MFRTEDLEHSFSPENLKIFNITSQLFAFTVLHQDTMRLRNGKIVDTGRPYVSRNRRTDSAAFMKRIRIPRTILFDLYDSGIAENVKSAALTLWWSRSKNQIILDMRADGLLIDTKNKKMDLILQWIQSGCSSKSKMFNFVLQNKRILEMARKHMMWVNLSRQFQEYKEQRKEQGSSDAKADICRQQ